MAAPRDDTYCRDTVRTFDRDRWLACTFAPAQARRRLMVLYCLNVELARIPELITEPMAGHIRLQWWRDSIEALEAGRVGDHAVLRRLANMVEEDDVAILDIAALIDAREHDVEDTGFGDMGEFEGHCRATGGALLRMALSALGVSVAGAIEAAEKVGTAHAMVGQLRNAAWLARRGRVGLPGELLSKHGVARDLLLAGRPGEGLATAAREIADRASQRLTEARALGPLVPGNGLPVFLLARITDAECRQLHRIGFDLFSGKTEPLPIMLPLAVLRGALTQRF